MAYKNETIRKVIKAMRETERKYRRMALGRIEMCISLGNNKIGRVMNVSLAPIISCGNCDECMKLCYDIKACMQYPHTVIDARIRNWVILQRDRDEYFNRIRRAISRRRKHLYFRWHVAGDIVDLDYFARMVEIAKEFPNFVFWTYTKMYGIVNEYVRSHGGSREIALPPNISVMFSEWRGMPMDNPYGFPEFRVVFKDETEPVGFYCPGNCDACKENRLGCIGGTTTYCREH